MLNLPIDIDQNKLELYGRLIQQINDMCFGSELLRGFATHMRTLHARMDSIRKQKKNKIFLIAKNTQVWNKTMFHERITKLNMKKFALCPEDPNQN